MAGIMHEVERTDLLEQVRQEAADAARQLTEAARLRRGHIVVVGCSTSEVVGHQVGSWSTPQIAQAIFDGLNSVFAPMGVYIAAQCCEHLNRALIVEHEAVPGAEIVNVLPQPKAGSSFATAAYQSFRHPVALEEIRADAGLDRRHPHRDAPEEGGGAGAPAPEPYRQRHPAGGPCAAQVHRRRACHLRRASEGRLSGVLICIMKHPRSVKQAGDAFIIPIIIIDTARRGRPWQW